VVRSEGRTILVDTGAGNDSSQFAFDNAVKREHGRAAGGYRRRWRERAEAAG
jgi:hypothetical protein